MGSCHSAPTTILSKKAKLNKTVNKLKSRRAVVEHTKQDQQSSPHQPKSSELETGDRQKRRLENEKIRLIDEDEDEDYDYELDKRIENDPRDPEFYSSSDEDDLTSSGDDECDRSHLPQIEIQIAKSNLGEEAEDEQAKRLSGLSELDKSNYDNLRAAKRSSHHHQTSLVLVAASSSSFSSTSTCLVKTMSSSKTILSTTTNTSQSFNKNTNLIDPSANEINNNNTMSVNLNNVNSVPKATSSASQQPQTSAASNRFGFKIALNGAGSMKSIDLKSPSDSNMSQSNELKTHDSNVNLISSSSSSSESQKATSEAGPIKTISSHNRRNIPEFKTYSRTPSAFASSGSMRSSTRPTIPISIRPAVSSSNTNAAAPSTNKRQPTHSSSLSSLSSSTSSNLSTNKPVMSTTTTTLVVQQSARQTKTSSLKTNNSANSRVNTTTTTVIKSAADNKSTTTSTSVSLGQNKRRLFAPYKLNINQPKTVEPSNVQKKPPLSSSTSTDRPNSEENLNPKTADSPQTQSQTQPQSRLNKYYSRMPIKSSLRSITKLGNKPEPSASKTADIENASKETGMSIKRDDSAYSSSTSSTGSERTNGVAAPIMDADKLASTIDEIGENLDQMSLNSVEFNNSHKRGVKTSQRNSIRDSVGELNQLMLISSVASIGCAPVPNEDLPPGPQPLSSSSNPHLKVRRTSSASLTSSPGALLHQPPQSQQQAPMFRPPSNLPPIENGEIIQMDIETYRALMQDLHNFKTILHRLANALREPSSCVDGGGASSASSALQDYPTDLLSSFYQHSNFDIDRCDQCTQTNESDS